MKKFIGKTLRRLLPLKYYKLVANGCIIVPAYYKQIINDTEHYMNCSLEESIDKDMLLLRKYAHIIDKGLHRKDAEPGHSMEIYHLLKSTLEKLSHTEYVNDPTYKWAQDRLDKYEQLQQIPEKFTPLGTDIVSSSIDYDSLFQLIKERRSCREFKVQPVSEDIILKLKEVVNWAPSSCNKQPIKLFTTNDADLSRKCLACCKGGTGFGEYIPSFWVFAANCRGYVYPTEMFLPTLDTSLGAQNVLLAAQTLGISGTMLTWAQKDDNDDKILRDFLNIPNEYQIVCCAVMGYPKYFALTPIRKLNQ